MPQNLWICRGEGLDPYENLAMERYLLERVGEGACILYLWQNENTVVIGRNQNPWAECRTQLLEEEGGRLARRLSGGGAVYHDLGNLNFTFLARQGDYDVQRQLSVIVSACRSLGIPAEISGRNDLLAAGRKFSGNAYYAHQGRCCHHGTLLVAADLGKMGRYLRPSAAKLQSKGVPSVRARVANLSEFLPGLRVEDVAAGVERAFSAVYGREVRPLPPEALDRARLARLAAENRGWSWLWGRKIAFTTQSSRRFPWGEVTVGLAVEAGVVREAAVYTDAMDWSFAASVERALTGQPYTLTALRAAVAAAPCDGDVRGDIAKLLAEQF